uniref:Uncharacterized protein n=1 Tax=Rhipicephalus zambeziensis TaxID=60191 RepID=A0A224Y9G7_9ACAR
MQHYHPSHTILDLPKYCRIFPVVTQGLKRKSLLTRKGARAHRLGISTANRTSNSSNRSEDFGNCSTRSPTDKRNKVSGHNASNYRFAKQKKFQSCREFAVMDGNAEVYS